MDIRQAIDARISRRSYLGTDIERGTLSKLKAQIAKINAQSGLTIAYLEDGAAALAGGKGYGMFSGVRALMLFKGPSDLAHLREKIGYYGERLVLEATMLGLGTCWVGGTFDKGTLRVPAKEELVCVVPVGNARAQSTLKERLIRGAVRRGSKPVEQLLRADEPLSDALCQAMALVQRAPTTRNQQRATFALSHGVITAHVPGDGPFDLVDLGICKLHLECGMGGKFEWGNGGRLLP